MADKTSNYNLEKQQLNDYVDIEGLNENFDIIDAQIKNASNKADQAFQSASNGKAVIKAAITGVDPTVIIPTDATFTQIASAVGQIKTGVDTSDATAIAGDILATQTAYGKGVKITGNMQNNGAVIFMPSTVDQTITKGYHNGNGKVIGDTDLVSGNIRAGVNIFGVNGDSNIIDTSVGDATAAQIISGKKAAVDGAVLTGTMTDKSGSITTAIGVATGPQTGYLDVSVPAAAYYDTSSKLRLYDVDFVQSSVKKGINIFGVDGTFEGPNLFNFPLSIQTTQPTAIKNGHIWVNSSRGGSIASAQILAAMNAGVADGTVVFEISTAENIKLTVSHARNLESSGGTITLSANLETVGNHPWLTGDVSGLGQTYLPYPRVFTKVGGVVYIETAYVWNGSSWILLSQADSYLGGIQRYKTSGYTGKPLRIWNRTGNTFAEHAAITTAISNPSFFSFAVSKGNGTYWAYASNTTLYVYKRVGDIFNLYATITAASLGMIEFAQPRYVISKSMVMSPTGDYIALLTTSSTTASPYTYTACLCILQNTGSGYGLLRTITITSWTYQYASSGWFYGAVAASDDFGVIGINTYSYNASSSYWYSVNQVYFGSPTSGYTTTSLDNKNSNGIAITADGASLIYGTNDSNNYPIYYVCTVDRINKTVIAKTSASFGNSAAYGCICTSNGVLIAFMTQFSGTGNPVYLFQFKNINGTITQVGSYSTYFYFPITYITTSTINGSMDFDYNDQIVAVSVNTSIVIFTLTKDANGGITAFDYLTSLTGEYNQSIPYMAFTPK